MSSNMLELETARVCGVVLLILRWTEVTRIRCGRDSITNHYTDLSMQDGIYPIRNGERMRLEGCGCSLRKPRGQ